MEAGLSSLGPLAGVRVVELAGFLSAPFATMMLADLGADVVKVETPKGDPFRRFGRSTFPASPMFVNANHGKRSVVLDLKQEDGKRAVRALLARTDVMVSNWRPAVAPRLGLDDEQLAEANPDLIRVYLSGFGESGPLSRTPTYDSVIQAHLGSVSDAEPDAPPVIASTYVVDKTAATMVCQAVLAALFARERGAGGQRIDISLLDAAAYVNFPDLAANRTFVDHGGIKAVNRHAGATRAIRASDGWIVVVPVTADQIRRAFATVGAPEIAEDLLKIRDAAALATRMFDALEERTRSRRVNEWIEAFIAADVPAGACLTLDEHLDDPQVLHNMTYGIAEWSELGRVRYANYPARFSSWGDLRATVPARPPALGEHTREILAEIAEVPAE